MPLTMAPVVSSGAEMVTDPAVGTRALNVNKSKLDASEPAPKSSVRTYSATADGLKVVIHTSRASGEAHDMSASFSYDGKPHRTTGSEDYDTVAVTRTGPNDSKSDFVKGGKVIGHLTRSISKDGKTMAITTDMINAKGAKDPRRRRVRPPISLKEPTDECKESAVSGIDAGAAGADGDAGGDSGG
jgi:hypothetical protein